MDKRKWKKWITRTTRRNDWHKWRVASAVPELECQSIQLAKYELRKKKEHVKRQERKGIRWRSVTPRWRKKWIESATKKMMIWGERKAKECKWNGRWIAAIWWNSIRSNLKFRMIGKKTEETEEEKWKKNKCDSGDTGAVFVMKGDMGDSKWVKMWWWLSNHGNEISVL